MFKNEYQGGPFVEIFSAQGKDPIAKWKLYGSPSAISKGFDKEMKSFVFVLEGSSQTNKMQLPKENKQMLGLIQRFLILQLYIPLGQDFSAELLVTDLANIKRRLYLSTVHRELSATPLHAKIPLFLLNRKTWCNLCIDLVSFTSGIFKGAAFQSLDGIIISANCKLRKIFTMKLKPQDSGEEADINRPTLSSTEPTDEIPRCCQITTDVHQVTQVLDFTKLNQNETKHDGRPLVSTDTDQIASKGQGSSRSNKTQDKSHIAFGSKVSGPPPATCKKMSSKLSAQTTRSTNRPDRSLNQQPCGAGDRTVLPTERRESLPSATHCLDQKDKENIHQTRKKEIILHGYQPHPPSESPTSEKINSLKGVGRIEKEMNKLSTVASSLGYCKNEDKLCVQIHMPSCERLNSAQTLNNSTVLQESTNLTDDWIFPDSFQDDTSKLSATQHQTDINNVSVDLADSNKNDSTNQRKTLAGDHDEILTYCSSPRTAPHGKFHSYPLDLKIVSLDSREPDSRGARMEDDFYGSDSSIEEAQRGFFQRASSPKFCHSHLQLSKPSQSFQSTDLGLHNTHRSMENVLTEDSLSNTPKEMTSSSSHILPIKTMNYESIQKNLMPTRSLSPDGSRPEISREDPIISKIQQVISIDNLRSSINKTILKEIPKEDRRFTADAHSYDWRNYQANRLSASEMQMLASLKRQQNEELEDYGIVNMLSQSQIDHCNVTISTSSDETTTWSSCLPPPVNQGRHYQEEMNPLTHSNPRDWLKAFSPPIMPTIQSGENMERFSKLKQTSTNSCNEGDDGLGAEEDEVLTLFYDPCLNCYFDPDTGKYYELA